MSQGILYSELKCLKTGSWIQFKYGDDFIWSIEKNAKFFLIQ